MAAFLVRRRPMVELSGARTRNFAGLTRNLHLPDGGISVKINQVCRRVPAVTIKH